MTDARAALRRAGIAFALFPLLALLAPLVAREKPWVSGRAGETILSAPVPFDPDGVDLDRRLAPPGGRHLLGTDELGRDVLARVLHGARLSVAAGLLASALALGLGAALGTLAGWAGATVTNVQPAIIAASNHREVAMRFRIMGRLSPARVKLA